MATATVLHAENDTATTAAAKTISSISPTAGTQVLVFAKCVENTSGADFDWAISNSGAAETWTLEETTPFSHAGNNRAQAVMWSTDAWSGAKDITVDPFASTGDDVRHYGILIVEITDFNGFEQAITSNAEQNTQTHTLTFGSAPTSGNLQLAVFLCGEGSGTITWAAPPTNWAELSGSTIETAQAVMETLTSTTNTSTTVAHDGGEVLSDWTGFAIEFAAAAAAGARSPRRRDALRSMITR